jgi:type I restriction enzyme S subunit
MEMNFTNEEFEKYKLSYGDILLNEGQSLELVGRPAIFRNEMKDVCFTNSIIQFRCYDEVIPEFAILIFRHYLHSGVFSRIAKITTNLAHLGASRFASLPFPVPSLDEQREIANIGQAHLDHMERLAQRITRLSTILETLGASIRSEGLNGRLVDQDEKDQPVEAALEAAASLTATVAKPSTVARRKGTTMKNIISVLEATHATSRALTGQQLFSSAGYPDDASSDLVERFYLDLRQQLIDGTIARQEVDGVDVFQIIRRDDQ